MGKDKQVQVVKGIGLDIGTMNLVAARQTADKVSYRRVRDAFITLDKDDRKMLRRSKITFVERDQDLIVVGDDAMELAGIMREEARRPLAQGLVSASEVDSLEILGILVRSVLGEPQEEGEICYYSVPAAPIDADRDVIYHKKAFERIITECGYEAWDSNEAMAIVFSEGLKDDYTGISMSFGSGMTNVALSFKTRPVLEFSISRCLAGDFPVITRRGVVPMAEVREGDYVLDAQGRFVEVLERMDNGSRDSLVEVFLEHLPAFSHKMTRDHRVFVRDRFGWQWVAAGSLREGDVVGVPTIQTEKKCSGPYYFGRLGGRNITVATARNLGKFLGMFLGDGSCGPRTEDSRFVQFAINRRDQHLVRKYAQVCSVLFHREVEVVDDPKENLTRVKLHLTPVARHLKARFYDEKGEKTFPLSVRNIPDSMALGVLEGLLDSDSTEEEKRHTIHNTSLHVVLLVHHLLNRFGIRHSVLKRPPRQGGINSKGVRIEGRKPCYDVRIVGHLSKTLLDTLLAHEGVNLHPQKPDFACFVVKRVDQVPYDGRVYDVRVASKHHSFSSPGMVVHNCGDWIDAGAAKSRNSTRSRICRIKEAGINLLDPSEGEESKFRDREALSFYYEELISYALKKVAEQFVANCQIELTNPIPIIVSGGTSKAGGFMDLFQKVFKKHRRRFPIKISEIRQAENPLNAVARGLLIQAMEEYEEVD